MKRNMELNLRMFDVPSPVNVTSSAGMEKEIKDYYDRNLLENATPALVHDQFAQTRDIPKGNGKKISFRRFDNLPKALTPLTEGVTPVGKSLNVTEIEAEAKQYGDYVTLSDVLTLTAFDPIITETTSIIGQQAGMTLDTISREVMNAGTNVQYAEGQVTSRAALTSAMKLTATAVKLAVRALKKQNAAKIDGYYVAIIHPDCSFDLREDEKWIDVVKYKNPERIYQGEIGTFEGVRFIETTEAKIFAGAGASGVDVYSTLFLGANAYATTKVEGAGLQTIIKQLGSAGSADPLNQRSTIGWKAMKVTEILSEQYMVRVETASTFSDGEAN